MAQYNASELLTKRNQVSKQIRDMLTSRSSDFHILLDDVGITHLAFSKEYTAAVEAKQVAQQEAERAKYIVERAIQEKKSIIIRAEGEAQAATLIGMVRQICNNNFVIWSINFVISRQSNQILHLFSCERLKLLER